MIANGSGSHHELRKLNTRVNLIVSATSKLGGVYMYVTTHLLRFLVHSRHPLMRKVTESAAPHQCFPGSVASYVYHFMLTGGSEFR